MSGGPSGHRHPAVYFRHEFRVPEGFFVDSLLVRVKRDGFSTARIEDVAANREDLEIVLEETELGALQGRLVDEKGAPLEGVRVSPRRKGPSGITTTPRALTDAKGKFRLQLWPDVYVVEFDVLGETGR